MFKLKAVEAIFDKGGTYVGGGTYKVMYIDKTGLEKHICLLNSWTMGSCAARSLYQFDCVFPFTEEIVQQLFDFLDANDVDYYNSRNIYMFLSEGQVCNNLHFLVKDLEVIDTFDNKGNGGCATMFLYRWVSPRIDDVEDDEDF